MIEELINFLILMLAFAELFNASFLIPLHYGIGLSLSSIYNQIVYLISSLDFYIRQPQLPELYHLQLQLLMMHGNGLVAPVNQGHDQVIAEGFEHAVGPRAG